MHEVNDIPIGGDRTFIIAEIGSNHCQSLNQAMETIDAAVKAGADAVKFQSICLEKIYLDPDEKTRDLHSKIDMPEDWHDWLKDYCDKHEVVFFSSPTYPEAVDLMEKVGVSLYKLASAQVGTFPQLVRKVARTGKPAILSAGLVTIRELEAIIDIFRQENNDQFTILHCTSLYPTPPERANLPYMEKLEMFGQPVGFSDHTEGIAVAIAAVAMGAKVIEKHFTLDKNIDSPDAAYSLEPSQFKAMVEGIRAVEQARLGRKRIKIEPEAREFKDSIRYRVVLNNAVTKGQALKTEDFRFLRHPDGVDCRDLPGLLETGILAAKDMLAGSLVHHSDLKPVRKNVTSKNNKEKTLATSV